MHWRWGGGDKWGRLDRETKTGGLDGRMTKRKYCIGMVVREVRVSVERSSPLAGLAHWETFSAFGPHSSRSILGRRSCACISYSAGWKVALLCFWEPSQLWAIMHLMDKKNKKRGIVQVPMSWIDNVEVIRHSRRCDVNYNAITCQIAFANVSNRASFTILLIRCQVRYLSSDTDSRTMLGWCTCSKTTLSND